MPEAVPHRTGETFHIPGLALTDHFFEPPLNYSDPDGETTEVYAREVVAVEHADEDLPWLIFLQGGPGGASPRPDACSGWIRRATRDYRVLLMDQRGVGRSAPITFQTLPARGDARAQAACLKHFRADNIVRDAEAIRRALLGDRKWTTLGQSYGGFCIATYLSLHPEGLEGAVVTGGIPSLTRPAEDVYRAAYPRMSARNETYYRRWPADRARVREIADFLAANAVELPSEGRLSPERFQQLGIGWGAHGGFEHTHYLVENAFTNTSRGRALSWEFLRGVENALHFSTGPLFVLFQELIYAQGQGASKWAAHRVRAEFPQFDASNGEDLFFTGEMMYPWMFDQYAHLRPMKEAANLLAEDDDWPRLYDLERLRANEVPVVAAVYQNDMYVDFEQSMESAREIRGLRPWVTNEYEHNGLRQDGERVLGRLLDMLNKKI